MKKKMAVGNLFVAIFLVILIDASATAGASEVTGRLADFHNETVVSRIAFGSCTYPTKNPQHIWKSITATKPDLWVWLGDAVYADDRLFPMVWKPAPLHEMADKFERQKQSSEYEEFLRSGVSVLGVWDDHDFGMNDGGKHYRDRLMAQEMYLDFLDEPEGSVRRRREGTYSSYMFGHGNRTVKLILLDVRSHHKKGTDCDFLGHAQWEWLENQLADPNPPQLTVIGSGMQILSDFPHIDTWEKCPKCYDRLLWLVQRVPRVVLISGDVHFGELSCRNNTSSGYPLYEVTSSGLTDNCLTWVSKEFCHWVLENIIVSSYRTNHKFTIGLNFGMISIDWKKEPVELTFEIRGINGVFIKHRITLDHLNKRKYKNAVKCPPAEQQPPVLKRLAFRGAVYSLIGAVLLLVARLALTIAKVIMFKILFPVLGINIREAFPDPAAKHLQHDSQIKRNKTLKND